MEIILFFTTIKATLIIRYFHNTFEKKEYSLNNFQDEKDTTKQDNC